MEYRTPNSIRKSHSFFHSTVNTPRFLTLSQQAHPFEMTPRRLERPMIESPLFPRPEPSPPQVDWTIDQVSVLNPIDIEAKEEQFTHTTDPESEAEKQAAINSYFQRHNVSTPDDCPLRNQKIKLINDSTEHIAARKKRDGWCQTTLTLPPTLPKEVEDALRPFFTYTQCQQQTPIKDCDTSASSFIDHEARDASMRRKLFAPCVDTSVLSSCEKYRLDMVIDSPTPQTPEMNLKHIGSQRCLTPHDTVNESSGNKSFGCISPILRMTITTPQANQDENSAPCEASQNSSDLISSWLYSTPNRSSMYRSASLNSINISVGDRRSMYSMKRKSFHLSDECDGLLAHSSSGSNDTMPNCSFEDAIQVTQFLHSSAQHHSHTPRLNKSKRRRLSVNRKNLSLSFNSYQCDENSDGLR